MHHVKALVVLQNLCRKSLILLIVVLISYKIYLFRVNFSETTLDACVSFLIFFSLKGLGWRTLTKQFFEDRVILARLLMKLSLFP